jgi:tRNA (guanine37-N1)-methyltransferase
VFIPVKGELPGAVEKELPLRPRKNSLREAFGIGSFDIIGDIVVILIPDRQWKDRDRIASHLVSIYPHVEAVYARRGAIGGEFRLPNLKLITGKGSETVHTERGLRFRLDVTKAYFSPRQSSEREKLLRYVKSGDVVAVFFAGIGPIPIYFSKFTEAKTIHAIEINPAACEYMRDNIRLNDCGNVQVVCGDASKEYCGIPPCDLVVLPLPLGSGKFVKEASAVLKPGGRAIFYVGSTEEELKKKLEGIKAKFEIVEVRREIQIAPRVFRFVIHARRH